MRQAVKFASPARDSIEGLGIPFGGSFGGKDVDGEWFTKSTDLALDWFAPDARPLIYHHGLDADAGMTVVGRVQSYKATDKGIWTKAQLDKNGEYFDAILELVEKGALFFSSGSMSHLAQRKKSGELTRWPWIELSLTPRPANLLAELDFATAEEHFKTAGIKSAKLDEIKTLMESDDSSGGAVAGAKATPSSGYDTSKTRPGASGRGDYAYVDSKGRGHLLIGTEGVVRAALARFNQTQFESPAKKKAAARKILARARKFNIDVADDDAVATAAKSADEDMLDATKALPDGPTLMSDDDGGMYPEGSYEDLAEDIARMLRQQTGEYAYVVATFPEYALVRCCDDGDYDYPSGPAMAYFRVAYTVGDDGEPQLAEMERVEPAMIPAGKSLAMPQTDEAPLAIQSARLSEYAALVLDRTKGINDRRIKEGRVLSTSNRDRLHTTADALEGALKALRDLLDTTEPVAKAAAVDRISDIALLKMWQEAMSD